MSTPCLHHHIQLDVDTPKENQEEVQGNVSGFTCWDGHLLTFYNFDFPYCNQCSFWNHENSSLRPHVNIAKCVLSMRSVSLKIQRMSVVSSGLYFCDHIRCEEQELEFIGGFVFWKHTAHQKGLTWCLFRT